MKAAARVASLKVRLILPAPVPARTANSVVRFLRREEKACIVF